MKSLKLIVALAAVLFVVGLAQDARAQGLYGFRNGYGPGGYCGSSLYSLGRIPVPPYFALHPPVYYSGIQPTTYGTSPFARRRHVDFPIHELPKPAARPASAPTLSVSGPQVVLNPFSQQGEGDQPAPVGKVHSASTQPSARPSYHVIENPFVDQNAAKLAQAR